MKDKIQLPSLLMYRAVQKTKIFRMSILMLKISFNRFCMSNPISSDLQTRGVGIIIEYWGITDKNHEVVTLSCHTCLPDRQAFGIFFISIHPFALIISYLPSRSGGQAGLAALKRFVIYPNYPLQN